MVFRGFERVEVADRVGEALDRHVAGDAVRAGEEDADLVPARGAHCVRRFEQLGLEEIGSPLQRLLKVSLGAYPIKSLRDYLSLDCKGFRLADDPAEIAR